MKLDTKKRERLRNKLKPITVEELAQDENEWNSVEEASVVYGVTSQTILNRIRNGILEARLLKGLIVVRQESHSQGELEHDKTNKN